MSKLSLRALNRATLQRQWLLERQDRSALAAIKHLVGMQAQSPLSPVRRTVVTADGIPDR